MRRGAALLVAFVLAGAGAPGRSPAAAATSGSIGDKIQTTQHQIDATQQRLATKRRLLHFQEVRAEDLRNQLARTNDGIAQVGRELDSLDAGVASNQKKLDATEVQLKAARATLDRHTEALERRLVDTYEHGDLGYINVLLSAASFSDFVERWDDIRYLIAANQQTVRERREAERGVESAEAALEAQRQALDASLNQQQQARYRLAALADERTRLVAVADAQRRSVANEVAQLEDLSNAEEAALEELIRERQRIEAARRAAEEAERQRAAKLAGVELPPVNEGAPSAYAWPVSGPITSPFGMRSDPLGRGFRMHTGIDIGAPQGSTVAASAGGRIIYAGWEGGYGNTIIIDHGGQASTLYGHLSQIFVSNGQDVQRGQAIGAVGCTGNCTGPHLHFEIRFNGVPVDPTNRLR